MLKRQLTTLLAVALVTGAVAQTPLTKEQILGMSMDELSELPIDELMQAVETLGVSSVDELFEMIMNKNVSSASKSEETAFTSPLSSSVITRDEMRTYGVTTIEEAFRLLPGMIVTEKSNGVYDVVMRGLNNIPDNNMLLYQENINILLMIDGRIANDFLAGCIDFARLPIDIEDVERIEVVRGAAGALYGANACQGVINIITEKPDAAQHKASGYATGGSHDTYTVNVAWRYPFKSHKVALGATINFQHRSRWTDKFYVIPATGVYLDNTSEIKATDIKQQEKLAASQLKSYVLTGQLTDITKGGWYSREQLNNIKQLYPAGSDFYIFNGLEPQTPAESMLDEPKLAKRMEGYNIYLTVTPSNKLRFDLTGGLQRSKTVATPVGDDYFSFNYRSSTTFYANLNADIYGLKFIGNYMGGSVNYAIGVPGFKELISNLRLSAEYDIKAGPVGIRPGFAFQRLNGTDYTPVYDEQDVAPGTNRTNFAWHNLEPGDTDFDQTVKDRLHGFFNNETTTLTFEPSLRLDYKHKGFRLVAGWRGSQIKSDDHKLDFQSAWQASVSQELGDKNFLRVVYGHSHRGPISVQTGSDFTWSRTNLVKPDIIKFTKNENPDMMKIDNVELGYRTRPVDRLLIDAEVFFSMSKDYGALIAHEAYVYDPTTDAEIAQLKSVLDAMKYDETTHRYDEESMGAAFAAGRKFVNTLHGCEAEALLKYKTLPFKVKQFGVSLNVDWIIHPKLIAKINLNFQTTKVDNYYTYRQTEMLSKLVGKTQSDFLQTFMLAMEIVNSNATPEYHQKTLDALVKQYTPESAGGNCTVDEETGGKRLYTIYADAINAAVDGSGLNYKHDGVKHKATPNFYGTVGLMYRPWEKINVSAFVNWLGKREIVTKYSNFAASPEDANGVADYSVQRERTSTNEDLKAKATVNLKIGYKPIESCEIFFNAHNLFNNKQREFVYCDETPGIYSVGVNFGF